jgi:cob(I)alamin adenosyltransferase
MRWAEFDSFGSRGRSLGEPVSHEPFDTPRLAINRVYTRQGDQGQTALAGGQRVPKDGPRIESYGTVDELNAFLGAARATVTELALLEPQIAVLAAILLRVQHELFNLGSILATLPEDVHAKQARVTGAEVTQLEKEMDRMNEELPPLRSFVLPGGSRLNAELHICRTVCRRAERACVTLGRAETIPPEAVRYLNRLSDALFIWSRWASHVTGTPETLWEPNQSTTGLSDRS